MSLNAKRARRSVYRALKRLKAGEPEMFKKQVAELLPPPPPVHRLAVPRRITLLQQASSKEGLRLADEAVPDRDMRSLITEGLLVEVTSKSWQWGSRNAGRTSYRDRDRWGRSLHRKTRLDLTEAGEAFLARTGWERLEAEGSYRPTTYHNARTYWYRYTDDSRRALLGDQRTDILRIRAPKGNEPMAYELDAANQILYPKARYLTFGFHDGETVFHHDEHALSETMIPAGRLRETGRGLVMEPIGVLQVKIMQSSVHGTSRNVRQAEQDELREIAPSVVIIERHGYLYVVTDSNADLIAARLVFGDGVALTHFETPKGNDR